jgi:hypothetical protein
MVVTFQGDLQQQFQAEADQRFRQGERSVPSGADFVSLVFRRMKKNAKTACENSRRFKS